MSCLSPSERERGVGAEILTEVKYFLMLVNYFWTLPEIAVAAAADNDGKWLYFCCFVLILLFPLPVFLQTEIEKNE